VPGSRPVNSTVPPSAHHAPKKSPFNRSEFEVFSHHTSGATGDAHGDKLLEWAMHPKFKPDRIRYTKMRTMGKKAIDLNIPGGVMNRDFSEKADGSQRMVFFSGRCTMRSSSLPTTAVSLESSTPSLRWSTLLTVSASTAPSTGEKCMRLPRGMLVQTAPPCQCF